VSNVQYLNIRSHENNLRSTPGQAKHIAQFSLKVRPRVTLSGTVVIRGKRVPGQITLSKHISGTVTIRGSEVPGKVTSPEIYLTYKNNKG
jgi:hypothetical protein